MEFIKIKEGVILRKRGCNFKQDTNIIARKKHAEIFLLDSKSFDFLKECNGLNSFGKIRKTYTDIFWEDKCHFTINTILKKFSEIIEVKNKKTPINKNQVIEVDDLECACRIAMWHLTNSCNLKCKHCYYMGGKEIKNIFNKKQIKSITNNLSNIGVEKVNITGGEPLLFKNELKYLVNLLNQKCLFFSVNTNAFEEIDILLDIFKRNNYAESIQVSLDGNKEIHENIRGKKGCYLKTCEHIKQLVNAGIQVRIVSMITRKWIGKEKDIFEIIKELGVKEWLLEVPSEAGRWKNNAKNKITKKQMMVICKRFINLINKEPKLFRKFTINQIYDWPEGQIFIKKKLTDPVCFHDLGLLSFGLEGISLCGPFRDKLPLYKFTLADTNKLKDAWNLISKTRISHKIGDNNFCKRCELFDYCQGGCPGQYSDSFNFKGCDKQSKFLSIVKKSLFEHAK